MSNSLTQIGIQLTKAIEPVIIIVGVVSNLLNITVLTRPALYYHACSRYLLALAGNNLFYSSFIFTQTLLSNGYIINLKNHSITACKIITYISTTSAFISPYLIVLASIDRYCATSANARIRRFSSIRVANWMIFLVIAFLSLLFVNILVLIDSHQEIELGCVLLAETLYSQVYIITQVFMFAVVPPSLMIVFGVMTIHNSKRVGAVRIAVSRFNRTEQQLVRMLFFQVSVYILLTLPTSILYLMLSLPNTIRYTTVFSFVYTICQFLFYGSYFTPFFLYLLSGRIYREELIRLVYKALRIRHENRVGVIPNQNMALPVISSVHPRRAALNS